MNILGINFGGGPSTAALFIDNKIVSCVSEERFSRKKNEEGYPKAAIEYCLTNSGLKPEDIDKVAVATINMEFSYFFYKKLTTFSVEDWIKEQKEYWYPILYQDKGVKYIDIFKDKLVMRQYPYCFDDLSLDDSNFKALNGLRAKMLQKHLELREEKIEYIEHHTGHAYYAYYGSPMRGKDALIFTMDGFGDGLNATVSIAKNNIIKRISGSADCFLGRLYRYMTLVLGMKPIEHEYKVMGLAAYATPYIYEKAYQIFKNTMYVDGLEFKYKEKPRDLYFWFKEKLEGCRFDAIAGGLQRYTEEIICQWVQNAIKVTGIRNVVFSGGVALNVKAMGKVAELPEVQDIFVCPSSGDESIAIGGTYVLAKKIWQEKIINGRIEPLKDVYLGPSYSEYEIKNFIKDHKLSEKYKIIEKATPSLIANEIACGKVIARMAGRMEFGARALGNRSILADPRDLKVVKKINDVIKCRDFWMPFAPTILAERVQDYILNPKGIKAPFMTITFPSTELAKKDIPAALHQGDFTTRPQILEYEINPQYYQLIKEFERLTGVGALLNTSFNLHGEPIVLSPEDAIHVFESSGLDMLLLEDTLVRRV